MGWKARTVWRSIWVGEQGCSGEVGHRRLRWQVRREWQDSRGFQLGEAGRNGAVGRRGRRRSQGCRVALTDHAGPCLAPEPDAAKAGTLRGSRWCPSWGRSLGCLFALTNHAGPCLAPEPHVAEVGILCGSQWCPFWERWRPRRQGMWGGVARQIRLVRGRGRG